jgi:hypothetical protein
VSCKGCQLLVDGIVVVDIFLPITTGFSTLKTSPCVSLKQNMVSEKPLITGPVLNRILVDSAVDWMPDVLRANSLCMLDDDLPILLTSHGRPTN